ncbi:MAG: SpoIIE family protein phosphatase [Spirochaetia bacterium]|nr:SpoIIE family protein phosphatase [Spirochaetia bacterium]
MRELNLSLINDITTRINSEQDLHGLLTVIMDAARNLLDTEGASLLLYDSASNQLIFDIARGPGGSLLAKRTVAMGSGIAGQCAETRQPIIVNDAATDARVLRSFDEAINFKTRNILAVPMLARDTMIGVLEVVNSLDNRNFAHRDTKLLSYLSNMAALAIHNRRLYENARDRMEELNCIYEISQNIRVHDNIDQVLDDILTAIENVLKVERLSVLFRDTADQGLRIAKTRGFSVEDGDARIDPEAGICGIVLRTGDPLLVRDVEQDLKVLPGRATSYSTKSFISVPIVRDGAVVGILNAADKKNKEAFDSFELRVLSTIAAQLSDAITRMLSREREAQIQMYRRDMETAAMIQMNSLPEVPSRIAGLAIGARYEACRDVGGDFYDLIYHSDDRLSFLMADVAGKGVPAALFMEFSKTLLSGLIPRNLDPVTTLTASNRELYKKSKMGIFVTVMLIQLERDLRRFRMASAGHNHQILYRKATGTMESLSAKGFPLGAFPECEYLEKIVDYAPGDLLLLYTDGITEANNPRYEEFGEERLLELVRAHADDDPKVLIDRTFEAVVAFQEGEEPSDDATMMAIRLA